MKCGDEAAKAEKRTVRITGRRAEMDNELLTQILVELREVKKREEQKQKAAQKMSEDAARRFGDVRRSRLRANSPP